MATLVRYNWTFKIDDWTGFDVAEVTGIGKKEPKMDIKVGDTLKVKDPRDDDHLYRVLAITTDSRGRLWVTAETVPGTLGVWIMDRFTRGDFEKLPPKAKILRKCKAWWVSCPYENCHHHRLVEEGTAAVCCDTCKKVFEIPLTGGA